MKNQTEQKYAVSVNTTRRILSASDKTWCAENQGVFFGAKSRNFKPAEHTEKQIVERLNAGHSVAPVKFDPAVNDNRSWRSTKTVVDCRLLLFDGDKWSDEHPTPLTLNDFHHRYPTAKDYFRWIGESVSSRTEAHPGLRLRLLVILPEALVAPPGKAVRATDVAAVKELVRRLHAAFPFLDEAVCGDISRYSYGNARPGALSEWLNGTIPQELWDECKRAVIAETERRSVEKKRRATARATRRSVQGDFRSEDDPLEVFQRTSIDALLTGEGYEHLGGNEWHHPQSTPGIRSFTVDGDVIKPFSSSINQELPPSHNENTPINGHRFLMWKWWQIDLAGISGADMTTLLRHLADAGYGTFTPPTPPTPPEGVSTYDLQDAILNDALAIPEYVDVHVPRGPSFQHFTPEETELVNAVMPRKADAGYRLNANGEVQPIFIPRYPFQLNGQPTEAERRRVYCTLTQTCESPDCTGRVARWIDRGYLTAGTHCETCHTETRLQSWAELQLQKKPQDVIVSDYPGYIADDDKLQRFQLWDAGKLMHLGAAMSTGKTTFLFMSADTLVQANPDARVIYLCARISQVQAVWEIYGKGSQTYGRFSEATHPDLKVIGTHGAISTISSLKQVFGALNEANIPMSHVHIVIDEVDFGVSLMNADIMKSLKKENKALLRDAAEANGIVVAGQTETLLALEAFAMELGLSPENISGYYKDGTLKATVTLFDYQKIKAEHDNVKAIAIANVIDTCKEVLAKGKRPYVFCTGRRTAEIIASELPPTTLIYTAYTRGDPQLNTLLKQQKTNAPAVICNASVDVGISIVDPDAYCIVLQDENPRHLAGIASTGQQIVRDRRDADREVHVVPYNNALPATPTFYQAAGTEDMREKLRIDDDEEEEARVVRHLSYRQAVSEFCDAHPIIYLQHQAKAPGFKVVVKDPDYRNPDEVRTLRKHITTTEKTRTTTRAVHILNAQKSVYTHDGVVPHTDAHEEQAGTRFNYIIAETDIRKLGTRYKLAPQPWEQVAHERAWQAADLVGFSPMTLDARAEYNLPENQYAAAKRNAEAAGLYHFPDYRVATEADKQRALEYFKDDSENPNLSESQLATATAFIEKELDYARTLRQINGYLAVHYPEVDTARFEDEAGETTHRRDYRRHGALITALLTHIPNTPITADELADAVEKAVTTRYGDEQIFTLMKKGNFGKPIARALRFIDIADFLETEARTAEQRAMQEKWLRASSERLVEWVTRYLPSHYPVTISKVNDTFQILKPQAAVMEILMECISMQLSQSDADGIEPQNLHVTPTESKRIDAHAEQKEQARTMWAAGASQQEIMDVTQLKRTAIGTAVKAVEQGIKPNSTAGQILTLLKDNAEWKTADIKAKVDKHPATVAKTLRDLVKLAHIRKVKMGVYQFCAK